MYEDSSHIKTIFHVIILIVLLAGALFLATKFGLVKCTAIPLWCDVYYSLAGAPTLLIVYGDDGLGDEQLLLRGLTRHVVLGGGSVAPVSPAVMHVDNVAVGNLKQYDLVLVTKARTIDTDSLKAFDQYVREGGRLVWTGDAGTRTSDPREYLYADQVDENAAHEIVDGGWSRVDPVDRESIIRFGRDILSANFKANYCEIRACEGDPIVGEVSWFSDPLTQGLSQGLQLQRDLAVVEKIESSLGGTTVVASVKTTFNLSFEGEQLGRELPFVIRSGPQGRVAYYAMPLESYLREGENEPQWVAFLQNMFFGMIP